MRPPKELRVSRDRRFLTARFSDEEPVEISAEMLRVLSPSAEVQGHSPDQRVTVFGKKDVEIARIDPVGNYAVRIVFNDGHETGLYTWSYLAELGHERDRLWQDYLRELEEKGLSRER
ncbi:DUF971 domain-containing protein [Chelativorans sp. AA-79]|uniref:DUF971 domain-containing protein n=1 Tax=Chelativorans sp. AA-79 TaxID=3028735 RepID=UPI0023F68778|nr:DUF971 domain-containing protein [Chelativorans sp. AA-79]WEX07233.1 DUF971 domain-containing protein [Chelativorans sp. AA-79]